MEKKDLHIDYTSEKAVFSKLISSNQISWIAPESIPPRASFHELLATALRNPINSGALKDEKAKRIALIVADATRLTCPFISQLLQLSREKTDEVEIVIACGSHKSPETDYLEKILGDDLFCKSWFRVRASSTQNPLIRYEHVGTTTRGTEVELDKELLEADLILSSMNIRAHYFAGWEGGAKALLPGCSSTKSIAQNHSYALDYEDARELKIDGNPIREDINEVPEILKKKHGITHRIVDFVANSDDQIIEIAYGEPVSTHKLLADICKSIYAVKAAPSPLAITVAEGPLGRNFYQALKACSHSINILEAKDGFRPVVILVASLVDGIGSPIFEKELERYAHMDREDIVKDLNERSEQGHFNEVVEKIYRLAMDGIKRDYITVGPEAPEELERLLRKVGIKFYRDLDDALSSLRPGLLSQHVNIIPRGASTVAIPK
ncbi:hypothetical protein A3K70_00570 [Candidatus Bathyarchaeota archaeon RBG_16_48_13]|nr:MAG: hypothetical protein A3K70_00570 [Candidatus Bathyarchaeota archaeon RBG_16_48_13]